MGAILKKCRSGLPMTIPQDDLRALACAACQHCVGSSQRQRYLTELIRQVQPRLWRDHNPYYQDALQLTWIYLCQNLCEGITGAPYDPERASIVTWLNAYLKYRLKDLENAARTEQHRHVSVSERNNDTLSVIDTLEARPDIPPILERVQEWLENNADELRSIHVSGHPEINCYVMILKRLPPETTWQALEQEFSVSFKTLESFYRRQCRPRLRDFGRSEGHLEH